VPQAIAEEITASFTGIDEAKAGRQLTAPDGRWLPITAGRTELRRVAAIPVTRYRYRGNTIPSPWAAAPA